MRKNEEEKQKKTTTKKKNANKMRIMECMMEKELCTSSMEDAEGE